jgi:hypothetical protein
MDQPTYRLTTAEMNAAIQWIGDKVIAHNRACPTCGSFEGYTIGSFVIEGRSATGGKLLQDYEMFPMLPLTCVNCGSMRFFNVQTMGLGIEERLGLLNKKAKEGIN